MLVLSTAFADTVVSSFRTILTGILVLSSFVPVVANSNNGTNSRTSISMVHTLSLNRVRFEDVFLIL